MKNFIGTPELTAKYLKATPGQGKKRWKQMVKENLADVTTRTIQYHTTLNPAIWENSETLRSEVRTYLLTLADEYKRLWATGVVAPEVIDIVLTGSNAGYNWTTYSDLDLHLVLANSKYHGYDALGKPQTQEEYEEELMTRLHMYKTTFNGQKHMFRGIAVEVYPQLSTAPVVSGAEFSLLRNQWNIAPTFDPPKLNNRAIQAKAEKFAREIDFALEHELTTNAVELLDQIAKMRKSGLTSIGEYSTENMVFKVLRNAGAIERLRQLKSQA